MFIDKPTFREVIKKLKRKVEEIIVNTLVFEHELTRGKKQHELLEPLNALGINKVEVRREYISDYKEIKSAAERFNMEIRYSVPERLYSNSLLDEKLLSTFFEEAKLLNSKHIKMTGGYAEEIKREDVDLLNRLISQYGISKFTIENDQNPVYSTGKNFQRLIRELRSKGANISLTFDIGNFLYVGEDPIVNAKLLTDFITVVHLKDVARETLTTVPLGEGDISFKEVFKYVPNSSDLVIEYPCGFNPLDSIKKEIKKLLTEERD